MTWNGHAPPDPLTGIHVHLARISERMDHQISLATQYRHETRADLREIKDRLAAGDLKHQDFESRLGAVEIRPSAARDGLETVSTIEKVVKSWATWLLPLLVAWATGSIDAAVKIAGILK